MYSRVLDGMEVNWTVGRKKKNDNEKKGGRTVSRGTPLVIGKTERNKGRRGKNISNDSNGPIGKKNIESPLQKGIDGGWKLQNKKVMSDPNRSFRNLQGHGMGLPC